MNEIVKTKNPVIMDISIFSNIAEKLNFLAQAIKDVKDAEEQLIYIECYTKPDEKSEEGKELRVIRFSTDVSVWTEVFPFNKYTTPLLEKSVAVNLHDLYNVVDNCNSDETEMISFRIDESNPESPQLVVSGFYNDLREYDELEVNLKIHKMGFPKREFKSSKDKGELAMVELDHLALFNIFGMNAEGRTDGVNMVIKDKQISFQTDYNGLKTILFVKSYEEQLFFKDLTLYLPYYFLNLMAGTGQIEAVKFHVYEDVVIVEAKGYNFIYDLDKKVDGFEISEEGIEDFCVVDPKNAEAVLALTNNINKPAKISVATIKKIEDPLAEIKVGLEDRYSASVLMECIMQSDVELEVDTDIFQWMLSNTQVDGIKIQRYSNTNNIYIKYENEIFRKTLYYNHDKFLAYRKAETKKLLGE